MRELEKDIDTYFGDVRNILDAIKAIPTANQGRLIKKTMYCSMLDTLATTRYPNRILKDRFVPFIEEYSDSQYWSCVSIPQLHYKYKSNVEPKYNELKQFLNLYISQRIKEARKYIVDFDPTLSFLKNNLGQQDATYANLYQTYSEEFQQFTYLTLFYRYRHILVHEMREPGYGFVSDLNHNNVPCYASFIKSDGNRETYHLVFPVQFFLNISSKCLSNLHNYFVSENKSPYDSFESRFGDAW